MEDILNTRTRSDYTNYLLRTSYIIELIYRLIQCIILLCIFYIKRQVSLEHPLLKFLCLYFLLNSARTLSFASKIKTKILHEVTLSSGDISGLESYEVLVELCLFVLYFRGFDYLELCDKCSDTEPFLYYTTKSIIFIEISLFLLPLVLIFLYILILMHRIDLFNIEDYPNP
ncbi:uncharacterized protein VNE69_01386 [Vairimorpha necatrix]|uniref:Membrane protein n=1 Tax=Vairimorpha necatrix TaxID=6039 RepID=A0AAX4J934_9MICR